MKGNPWKFIENWKLKIKIYILPTYTYSAKTATGQARTGSKEAASESEVARALREEGLILTSIAPLGASAQKRNALAGFFSFLWRIPLSEKMMFARHLAVMIGAGLPLNRALDVLILQTKNKKFSQALGVINERVRKGEAFSDALAQYPGIFSSLFTSLVKVGEAGGNLEETLKILAEQMRKDYSLRSHVKSAMIYPMIIIAAMVGIGAAMMVLVVPKLSAIFKDLNMELPLSTRLIIFTSDFLRQHIILGLSGILAAILVILAFLRSQTGKNLLSLCLLKVPIFAGLVQKINSARFARTLGSLIAGGLPIVRSLQIVAETLSNSRFRTSLLEAAQQIQKGEALSQILKRYRQLYPPLVEQMVAVGEETGTLDDILRRLAEFYEEEVTNITKGLASIIEPILMIVIGAAVGFFAISMLQPMYSMVNAM